MRKLVSCVAIPLLTALASTCGARRETPERQPGIHDLIAQARKLDLSGRHESAIASYRQALARDPNSYDAHYGIARALDLVGAYDEARGHFAKALELAPDGGSDQARRMLGISWTFSGNLAAADGEFQRVFNGQLTRRDFAAAAEEADELGRLHLEFDDLDAAESWYRRGHDVAGQAADRPQWQIDLADLRWAHAEARIAARRNRAREAASQAAVVERLLGKGGNDDQRVQYAYLRGYVDFYLGKYREAARALTSADQQDPAVLLLRGEAAERLGQSEEARRFYRRIDQSSAHSINNAFARPLADKRLSAAATR